LFKQGQVEASIYTTAKSLLTALVFAAELQRFETRVCCLIWGSDLEI
jgi:hypothetical protein